MRVPLDHIASVRTLTTFRDRAPDEARHGNALVLSIRDLVSRWPLDFASMPRVDADDTQLGDALQPDDILMPGRGAAYPARLFPAPPLPVISTGQVFVIRATAPVVPAYLCWYLNTPGAQAEIAQLLAGSAIQALNKSSLLKMRVPLPSLPEQEQIAELQKLAVRRRFLREELESIERADIEHTCLSLLQKRARYG